MKNIEDNTDLFLAGWCTSRRRFGIVCGSGTSLRRPLNPDFEAWELDAEEEGNLRVIAEFVTVLD